MTTYARLAASLVFAALAVVGCGGDSKVSTSGSSSGAGAASAGSSTGSGGASASSSSGVGGSGTGGGCAESCEACTTCAVAATCKPAFDLCGANSECVALDACVALCPPPPQAGCISACAAAHPIGVGDYDAYAKCIYCDACDAPCGVCGALGCIDGVEDGDETATDCGGATCAKCGPGAHCGVDGDCNSGNCVSSICCNAACTGGCMACSAAETGGVDGACGPVLVGADPLDACAGTDACDGAGSCQCQNGVVDGAETGVDCGGAVCGKCNDGQPCGDVTDCASGHCIDGVCCATGCSGICEACSAAKKGSGVSGTCGPIKDGTDPDGECSSPAADVCNGAGVCRCHDGQLNGDEMVKPDCNGICGVAACNGTCSDSILNNGETAVDCGGPNCPNCGNGKTCAAGGDCSSGFCVDGVCCGTACTGTCQACVTAKTGQANGTCAPIPSGQDPDGECTDQGGASCGTTGVCDGASACAIYPMGTPCGSALSCSGTTQTNQDGCSGGACIDAGTTSCVPYVCGMGSCKTSCGGDADCSAGNYCAAPACLPKLANGVACGAPNQCQSGACVDGVCCNSACGGTCQACSAAKKGQGANGVCAAIAPGGDPDNECAPGACNGAGVCQCADGVKDGNETDVDCGGGCNPCPNAKACIVGPDCQSGHCVSGQCCDQQCGANAACFGGTCGCLGTWQDCNASQVDGCESDSDSDKVHCGSCGIVCFGARYECCSAQCRDLCNPPACNVCGLGCDGSEQCYGSVCGQACPCLSPDTPIATPDGERAAADLAEGDLVYSVDHGAVVVVPIARTSRVSVRGHHVARVVLASGRVLEVTPGHPTADGRTFADLAPGSRLGGERVVGVTLVGYDRPFTVDLLPASDTGAYFAGGALVGSTLVGERCGMP